MRWLRLSSWPSWQRVPEWRRYAAFIGHSLKYWFLITDFLLREIGVFGDLSATSQVGIGPIAHGDWLSGHLPRHCLSIESESRFIDHGTVKLLFFSHVLCANASLTFGKSTETFALWCHLGIIRIGFIFLPNSISVIFHFIFFDYWYIYIEVSLLRLVSHIVLFDLSHGSLH